MSDIRAQTKLTSKDRFQLSDRKKNSQRQCSVLFVCWANLCRSPAATSVLEQYIANNGTLCADFTVDSAGVSISNRIQKASLPMRWAAYRRGYPLKRQPRRIIRPDLDRFDMVIAMDRRVLSAVRALHSQPRSSIRLFSEFLPDDQPQDIPDPMNRITSVCDRVLDMIEMACPQIVAACLDLERDAAGTSNGSASLVN